MGKFKYEIIVDGVEALSPKTKQLIISTSPDNKIQIRCEGEVIVSFWESGELRFYKKDAETLGFTTTIF